MLEDGANTWVNCQLLRPAEGCHPRASRLTVDAAPEAMLPIAWTGCSAARKAPNSFFFFARNDLKPLFFSSRYSSSDVQESISS